ncbi:hypothetical protein PsB1_1346 [Candidatus Phycosocius spiralis]|uniref:Uncharacterized protein n=1 Tax=Candidatus Phycosocius spiralis TaxID=2815099 RepID=A0ABQ4PVX4_9PROT|nr:hypothetical protein PsB1_1346 [Candidatus Phycosocius spiralis]
MQQRNVYGLIEGHMDRKVRLFEQSYLAFMAPLSSPTILHLVPLWAPHYRPLKDNKQQ